MNILDFIEACNLDRHQLSNELRIRITQTYEIEQWIRAGRIFVRGLDRNHRVPGNYVNDIMGICQHYKIHETITAKQRHYLAQVLIDHWDQLSCETRAQLYIC